MERNAELELREATMGDVDFLYELRNDDAVRKNSFHTERILYEEHVSWFGQKLVDADVQIFVLIQGEKRIGQVRVDAVKNQREISYALCEEVRGKGYAKWMLGSVESKIRSNRRLEEADIVLIGEVKRENIASKKIFRFLDYEEEETEFGFRYSKTL